MFPWAKANRTLSIRTESPSLVKKAQFITSMPFVSISSRILKNHSKNYSQNSVKLKKDCNYYPIPKNREEYKQISQQKSHYYSRIIFYFIGSPSLKTALFVRSVNNSPVKQKYSHWTKPNVRAIPVEIDKPSHNCPKPVTAIHTLGPILKRNSASANP